MAAKNRTTQGQSTPEPAHADVCTAMDRAGQALLQAQALGQAVGAILSELAEPVALQGTHAYGLLTAAEACIFNLCEAVSPAHEEAFEWVRTFKGDKESTALPLDDVAPVGQPHIATARSGGAPKFDASAFDLLSARLSQVLSLSRVGVAAADPNMVSAEELTDDALVGLFQSAEVLVQQAEEAASKLFDQYRSAMEVAHG